MNEFSVQGLTKEEKYQWLLNNWPHFLDSKAPWFSNLSNAMALINELFNHWWTGIYLVVDGELVLGPFQGTNACTRIEFGKGVCGTAWKQKCTQLVPNVHEFPGHIACSSASNSEIVVPIFDSAGDVWAVLDIDSVNFSEFDQIDQHYLEKFCQNIGSLGPKL